MGLQQDEEERAKDVKHLDEKVPEQADVGREVWDCQSK